MKTEGNALELWDLLNAVSASFKRIIGMQMDPTSLKPIEIKMLNLLNSKGGMQINAIAEELSVTGPWITGIVKALQQKGYVKKVRNEGDRRRLNVTITPSGKKILVRSMDTYLKAVGGLLDKLSAEDIEEFKRLLSKISDIA
ncbi:MAG: MarR family winged helix-turn-helix transcriptional regulator [Candidatus Thermoplasmatota archaeon]|nr:MarR family winged helix-turn-helix transcriptional regulator [Candidatus Thermoplasmatota archaeon]